MEPKVSVIIPVYNVEPFLVRCLDSVVGQTLRDIEIICVDDGSPDRSIDILNRYAAEDARIRVISQENRGLGGARNRGFDAATGEFVLYVDSDDWIDPAYCERLYEAARETGARRGVRLDAEDTPLVFEMDDPLYRTAGGGRRAGEVPRLPLSARLLRDEQAPAPGNAAAAGAALPRKGLLRGCRIHDARAVRGR